MEYPNYLPIVEYPKNTRNLLHYITRNRVLDHEQFENFNKWRHDSFSTEQNRNSKPWTVRKTYPMRVGS